MTTKEWDKLYKKDNKLYTRQYIKFMYYSSNSYCCENCPHGDDICCGKGNNECWVDVHCDYLEREEENENGK